MARIKMAIRSYIVDFLIIIGYMGYATTRSWHSETTIQLIADCLFGVFLLILIVKIALGISNKKTSQ